MKYQMVLERLSGAEATFGIAERGEELVLPATEWETMGRPGHIEVEVRSMPVSGNRPAPELPGCICTWTFSDNVWWHVANEDCTYTNHAESRTD